MNTARVAFRVTGTDVNPKTSFNIGIISGILSSVKGVGAVTGIKNERRFIVVSQRNLGIGG